MKPIIKKASIIIAALLVLLLVYMRLETKWVKIKTITISDSDIPSSFVGKKIVFITDVHYGNNMSEKHLYKIIDKINSIEPDIVIMGGDYANEETQNIIDFYNAIENINSTYGIYAVMGNHDYWSDIELNNNLLHQKGVFCCDNKSFWVKIGGDSIKIGGVGDLWESYQALDSTTFDLNESDFSILISHNPDYIENMNTENIDLLLAGHSHGGQISFFGLYSPILPSRYGQKYRYGMIEKDDMKAYISSGLGTVSPSLRFSCRPEIVVIELEQ